MQYANKIVVCACAMNGLRVYDSVYAPHTFNASMEKVSCA